MGPGFWPALLALALLAVAVLLLWRDRQGGASPADDEGDAASAPEPPSSGRPQAAALTLAAVLAFAIVTPVAGVALSTWLLAVLAARAADNRWPQALLIGSALTVVWLLVFVYGLKVPFRLLPPALPTLLPL